MNFAELVSKVDPLTALAVVGFWVRWELWSRRHRREHEVISALLPAHEVTHG